MPRFPSISLRRATDRVAALRLREAGLTAGGVILTETGTVTTIRYVGGLYIKVF